MSASAVHSYRRRRDLRHSGEPYGHRASRCGSGGFVIQRHDTPRLHYDFRLQIGNVLVSWAVPKGPSVDPADKRLATRTDDHPMEYAQFEGVIPSGYGAGSVVVWDTGSFEHLTTRDDDEPIDEADALRRGHLKFRLYGRKLRGEWALTQTKMRGDDRNWILVKTAQHRVSDGGDPVADATWSVLTGRTEDEVVRRHDRAAEEVTVPNPDKPMFGGDGVTKVGLVHYYERVAGSMLPHLLGRPLAMRRYPDGIGGHGFVQQHAGRLPELVRVVEVPRANGSGSVRHVVCDDVLTLKCLAGQACIELHPWTSRVGALDRPDRLVLDLDPASASSVADLRSCARHVRTAFERVGLRPFLQSTGGRGYHVVAPLDGSSSFEIVRRLADGIAGRLAARAPGLYTTAQRVSDRGDRIYLDTGRNAYGQTWVSPYSLRARPGAPVATPLDWRELGRSSPAAYDVGSVPHRLAHKADPWAWMDASAAAAAEALARLKQLSDEKERNE